MSSHFKAHSANVAKSVLATNSMLHYLECVAIIMGRLNTLFTWPSEIVEIVMFASLRLFEEITKVKIDDRTAFSTFFSRLYLPHKLKNDDAHLAGKSDEEKRLARAILKLGMMKTNQFKQMNLVKKEGERIF